MTPPNRQTVAGQVYLDLRRLAQITGRATDELLLLYALEGAELPPKKRATSSGTKN